MKRNNRKKNREEKQENGAATRNESIIELSGKDLEARHSFVSSIFFPFVYILSFLISAFYLIGFYLYTLSTSLLIFSARLHALATRLLQRAFNRHFLFIIICLLFFGNSANAKECKLMEPEVLKRHIANKTILDIIMLDVRPRFDISGKRSFDLNTNIKRIPFATPAPFEDIKEYLVGKADELIDKDVILVGENTESAIRVCKYLMIKDYGIRNIYFLKGGVKEWDGPLAGDITKVECEVITSPKLINIIKANREVEIIDQRQADEYHEAHIPDARLENKKWDMQPPLKYRLQKQERRKKWEEENTTVVYVYPNEFQAMRDCRYVKYFSYGYKDIYVLRGGMKAWEGEVEIDYLEVLKKKVKERLK